MAKMKISSGLSRKEARKAHRQAAKDKKQQRFAKRAAQKTSGDSTESRESAAARKGPIANAKASSDSTRRNVGIQDAKKPPAKVGSRRKRWKPEEIDPMIAAEDAEIKRLERLLGVSGPNAQKKRAKLQKELEEEDGLGGDFGEFLAGLDRLDEIVEGGVNGSSDEDRDMEDWDFHEDVPEDGKVGSRRPGEEGDATSKHKGPKLPGKSVADHEDAATSSDGGSEDVNGAMEEGDEDELDHGQESDDTEESNAVVGDAGSVQGLLDDDSQESEEDETNEDQQQRRDTADDAQEYEGDTGEEGAGSELGADSEDSEGLGPKAASTAASDVESGDEDSEKHTYRPRPGQDIYGRPTGSSGGGMAPAKYIPPHLRSSGATGSGEAKRVELQKVVNGIMNRLSEDTLDPVTTRLRDTYRKYSTTEVNEALWTAIRTVCVHDKQVMSTLIPTYAAVIAALNISLGADVGGFFLETVARELDAESFRATAGRPGRRGIGLNLVLLLAYLYNFGVAHCSLVYDLVRLMVDEFRPADMEPLLFLLRHSGHQLRADDPQALKQIVAAVKEKRAAADVGPDTENPSRDDGEVALPARRSSADEAKRWKATFESRGARSSGAEPLSSERSAPDGDAAASASEGGSRARYVLDTILELQSNKRSRLTEQGREAGRRVRKWLGSVKAAKGGSVGGDASLRVTWSELVSTESRGRWWKVGAAWAGRDATPAGGALTGKDGGKTREADSKILDRTGDTGIDGGLAALATRQRMNTDVRRSLFIAVVGSSDCEDALEKILRLNLKGPQEREIARVIIECCCQEAAYNPFYAHLAERVCDRQPQLRFTFQVAFWDAMKTLDPGASRRAGSLARLMAHLVVQKQLSLLILKSLDITQLSPSGLLLMRVFFHELIETGDDTSFLEVYRKLVRPPNSKDAASYSSARDNILVFLKGHLGPVPSAWDGRRAKAFVKRVQRACTFVETIVASQEFA